MAQWPTEEELTAEAIAAFPFERIETSGELALSTWQQLKSAGRGTPLVLGGDEEVAHLMDALDPAADPFKRSATEILLAAGGIQHPEGLAARRVQDEARMREYLRQRARHQPAGSETPREPTLDEARTVQIPLAMQKAIECFLPSLPATVGARGQAAPGLSAASDSVTGRPLPKVHIALIPSDDWTTIPAHLNWGGWNACPHPEYHVAALRSWRDRFGVELVGLSHDTMNLTVSRPPATAEAALELAREQYDYCGDVVHWGTETVERLAAILPTEDWWFFWWD